MQVKTYRICLQGFVSLIQPTLVVHLIGDVKEVVIRHSYDSLVVKNSTRLLLVCVLLHKFLAHYGQGQKACQKQLHHLRFLNVYYD